MSIAFAQTPAREAAHAAMRRAQATLAHAEDALAAALADLERHQRPDSYARVHRARTVLRAARRAYDRADARWVRA